MPWRRGGGGSDGWRGGGSAAENLADFLPFGEYGHRADWTVAHCNKKQRQERHNQEPTVDFFHCHHKGLLLNYAEQLAKRCVSTSHVEICEPAADERRFLSHRMAEELTQQGRAKRGSHHGSGEPIHGERLRKNKEVQPALDNRREEYDGDYHRSESAREQREE